MVDTHFSDQAQIEHFGVMGQLSRFIRIGMQVVAGELIAIAAKVGSLAI